MNDNKRECNRCPNCDRRPYIDGHSDECLRRSAELASIKYQETMRAIQAMQYSNEVTK